MVVKNQHYVPRTYLRHFTHDGARIRVIEKSGREFESNISKMASEMYFYDIPEVEGQAVEKFLGDFVEPLYSGIINKIKSKLKLTPKNKLLEVKVLSDDDLMGLAIFLYMQFTRTRKKRNLLIKHFEKEKRFGEYEEMAKRLQAIALLSFRDENLPAILNFLNNFTWTIGVNNTEVPFFTSDDPVVLFPKEGDKSKVSMMHFPLSSEYCLSLVEYDEELESINNRFIELDQEHVILLNKVLTSQSHRFIFGPTVYKENF